MWLLQDPLAWLSIGVKPGRTLGSEAALAHGNGQTTNGAWGTRCGGSSDRVTGVVRDSLHMDLGCAGEG